VAAAGKELPFNDFPKVAIWHIHFLLQAGDFKHLATSPALLLP
jgi:hypothetical protein